MQLLEDRIRKDGKVREGNVLKVDSFLNHQMDIRLFDQIGEEFKKRFEGTEINKILTIEASGIGIACVAARHFDVPVVFAKKSKSINIEGDVYVAEVESFTHKCKNQVIVSKKFINPEDKILIIDDFLANGEAAMGASRLIKESGAELSGIGILIEKSFQKGRKRLEDAGYYVYSQARIGRLDKGVIEFLPEDAPVLEGVDEKELLDK